jgi:predicted NAD/FAD-dependent oxidoreductase
VFVLGQGEIDPAPAEAVHAELHRRVQAVADRPDGADGDYGTAALGVLAGLVAAGGVTAMDEQVVRAWLRGEIESLYAAPMHDLSLRHGVEPYRLDGEDVMINTPLDEILSAVAGDLDVRCRHRVRTITRDGDGRGWRLGLQDGSVLRGSAVVLTVPIGVLRTLPVDPPLPPPVRGALARMGAGAVAKVFLRFDEPFWAPHPAFWLAGPQPPAFGLWVDASSLAGFPCLGTFAVGEDARWAERASEDELCRRADELLAAAGFTAGPADGAGRRPGDR